MNEDGAEPPQDSRWRVARTVSASYGFSSVPGWGSTQGRPDEHRWKPPRRSRQIDIGCQADAVAYANQMLLGMRAQVLGSDRLDQSEHHGSPPEL
jgi:hypothetical protein